MPNRPGMALALLRRLGAAAWIWTVLAVPGAAGETDAEGVHNLFAQFALPDSWETRFWADPDAKALLDLEPKALADLVPVQAGMRYCRCPACEATEADDPLTWSIRKPKLLTCRRCGVTIPNDDLPAKDKDKKVPEEVVEVLPRVLHHYPYHAVKEEDQLYPDERIYLDAKRDYETREFLAKAALYAAVRYHEQPDESRDPRLARLVCTLILRFAQVYPAYATHLDQPGQPKIFQRADLPPPYRRGYRTGKWDWTASLNVPLNLVIAYALIRDEAALAEAGRLLGAKHPSQTIERDLFRASAEFVRLQPEEYSEMSLQAYRGLLAVGRLESDTPLIREVLGRLDGFTRRGFYYDGFWRQGDAAAHRRVLGVIDGWIERLLAGYAGPTPVVDRSGQRLQAASATQGVPMLALARGAASAILSDPPSPEIQQAAWPTTTTTAETREPLLLGGVGLGRLALGDGASALDLEVRGQDNLGAPHFQRLALRLAVGGHLVLGDLDEQPPTLSGWDRSTASHNTVVVDGLNQGETLARAFQPSLGSDFLFFAADPDFQVLTIDDRLAYPQSTTRYRQTLLAVAGARSHYAVSVFEVHGGLQHDQIFHAAPGLKAQWETSVPMVDGPATLLPATIPYVSTARAEDRRWFVQAYGEFAPLRQGRMTRPAMAWLAPGSLPGVRLHMLSDLPVTLITASSPDATHANPVDDQGRAGLIIRRRSENGATLKSRFVTVFEPTGGAAIPLTRVGRVASSDDTVVLIVESAGGTEHLIINLNPGTPQTVSLASGERLSTDGVAVRVSRSGIVLAGGTFAESAGLRVEQHASSGTITAAVRQATTTGCGWFETHRPLAVPDALVGRTLMIRHGDGTTRGWTLQRVENTERSARLFVREEPGFTLASSHASDASYYQFPKFKAPAPHHFRIDTIVRRTALPR